MRSAFAICLLASITSAVSAQPPEVQIHTFNAAEPARTQVSKDKLIWHELDSPFIIGDPPLVVSIVRRKVSAIKLVNFGSGPDGAPKFVENWSTKSLTGERIVLIDSKSQLPIRQVQFVAGKRRNYHFARCFQLTSEVMLFSVRPEGDFRKISEKELFWKWNVVTNKLEPASDMGWLWTLQAAIDRSCCQVDESEIAEGRARMVNSKTSKGVEFAIDESAIGRHPVAILTIIGVPLFFHPTAIESSVIVIRKKESIIECFDTEVKGGVRWRITEPEILKAAGLKSAILLEVGGVTRPCATLPVLAYTFEKVTRCLLIDTATGEIQHVINIDSSLVMRPVVSANSHWMVFGKSDDRGRDEGLRRIDLHTAVQSTMPPVDEFQNRQRVVGASDRSIILEVDDILWEVLPESDWKRTKFFELPLRQPR